ncbi:MAG: serine/threonine protein kinase, partial [Anaerolineae bacterium]
MNTLIGRTLKNSKIIELLGQGGMAQVYRAERLPSGEQVALKVMHPHLVTETDFLRRFYREAKAIATLKHPNIIKVYDFIPPGDIASPCIIMQLVKGPTLQACLAEAARFGETWSLNAVLHLIEPLAGAIDYAHSRGMIHRDIKPTNIILQPVPPASPIPFYEKGYTLTSISSLPILTDFGMARLVDDTRLTMTGAVAGTPTYISPEQANGQPAGPASDLYSFGVVAYEMVTGQAPFAADTPMATMFQHMNAAPPSPGQLRPNLNPAIDKVLLKALAKNPADRYPNAQTFARFLRQAIETGTVPQEIMAHTFTVAGQFGPGSVIDNRYHVEAVLGQGAFSQVYKVTDRQEGEPFALKIIADRELGLDHLKREFRALSKLRHPSIARVVDAGQLRSGQYYLKLEFVAGKSLETCMAEDLLSEEKKVELLEDILDALVYMEGQGFLHRDLKPSNIIVTTTGASIIDFNVSKPLAEATRTQVGTPRYMPPEVPHVGWNKTGDLYAVGLIFYELFTGRLPFLDAASLSAWDIPDPREFAPALPEGIARVLVKAIARKPEDRFAGAAGMLAAARRARIQSGVPGKVSPHIAPAAPAAEPATPTR